jgi:hypothetical protein
LAILFSDSLLPDCEYPEAGPFVLVPSIFSCCTSAIQFLLDCQLVMVLFAQRPARKASANGQGLLGRLWSSPFPGASWSEVKACAPVLHLQVAFDFTSFPVPGMSRPISLGGKAMKFTIAFQALAHTRSMLLPQARVSHLVTIEQCFAPGWLTGLKPALKSGHVPMPVVNAHPKKED